MPRRPSKHYRARCQKRLLSAFSDDQDSNQQHDPYFLDRQEYPPDDPLWEARREKYEALKAKEHRKSEAYFAKKRHQLKKMRIMKARENDGWQIISYGPKKPKKRSWFSRIFS